MPLYLIPPDVDSDIAIAAKILGLPPVQTALVALKKGLREIKQNRDTYATERRTQAVKAITQAPQPIVSVKSSSVPLVKQLPARFTRVPVAKLSIPAKPLTTRELKEPFVSVNIGGINSHVTLRQVKDSKITSGCICSVCDDAFELSPTEYYDLQIASRKTRMRPRCEKCGGNSEMIARAERMK